MELSIRELKILLDVFEENQYGTHSKFSSIRMKLTKQLEFQAVQEAEINQEIATLMATLDEKKKELEKIVNG